MPSKKARSRSLQQRIEQYITDWRPVLGVEGWDIRVTYDSNAPEIGYCVAKPRYLTAIIGFNLPRMRRELRMRQSRRLKKDPRHFQVANDIEELVLHELVHCPMWKNSERAVTQMTYALLRSRTLGNKKRA